jgi:hypothetical protein
MPWRLPPTQPAFIDIAAPIKTPLIGPPQPTD